MALEILSEPSKPEDAERITDELRGAIEHAIPGAGVQVRALGPGHFEIDVVSETFEGESRVKQQRRVYAAIARFMTGGAAPVHAVDRLTTSVS